MPLCSGISSKEIRTAFSLWCLKLVKKVEDNCGLTLVLNMESLLVKTENKRIQDSRDGNEFSINYAGNGALS